MKICDSDTYQATGIKRGRISTYRGRVAPRVTTRNDPPWVERAFSPNSSQWIIILNIQAKWKQSSPHTPHDGTKSDWEQSKTKPAPQWMNSSKSIQSKTKNNHPLISKVIQCIDQQRLIITVTGGDYEYSKSNQHPRRYFSTTLSLSLSLSLSFS